MVSILDVERSASRLRHHLKRAQLPELQLLCGLKFFEMIAPLTVSGTESYFREFVPSLAGAARRCNPNEFLPEEIESLSKLIEMVKAHETGAVNTNDLTALEELSHAVKVERDQAPVASTAKGSAPVTCLFVEYYPDLDLPPRGRLLNMYVTASVISSKAETDDVVVRNPVEEPDDRFLSQARDSVKAARMFLHRRFGLSLKKRYRFDFAVDSTGARFTGDSLGVAFGVGAIAAVGKISVFREQLLAQPDAVFSGALMPDGKLSQVDADALRLKIYRAFHSSARYLVVPADHLAEAKTYVRELEGRFPARRLELAGVEILDAVLADSRLMQSERLSLSAYSSRQIAKAGRSTRYQVPILLALLYIMTCILFPRAWVGFDWNPEYVTLTETGFVALNADSVSLWSVEYECNSLAVQSQWKVGDLDGDGRNEVAFMPKVPNASPCESNVNLYVYEHDGEQRFRQHCAINGEYPGDTSLQQPYSASGIDFVKSHDSIYIVTAINQSFPARAHIKSWSISGDSLGWFVNGGAAWIDDRYYSAARKGQLLFMGINNWMGSVCLFALPHSSSYGASPPYSDTACDLKWVKHGNQLCYVLFPPTDANKSLGYLYNIQDALRIKSDDIITVITREKREDPTCGIWYHLDSSYRVVSAQLSDGFMKTRNALVADGKLEPVDWGAYAAELRDAVTYWTDSGWVTEGQLRDVEDIQ